MENMSVEVVSELISQYQDLIEELKDEIKAKDDIIADLGDVILNLKTNIASTNKTLNMITDINREEIRRNKEK